MTNSLFKLPSISPISSKSPRSDSPKRTLLSEDLNLERRQARAIAYLNSIGRSSIKTPLSKSFLLIVERHMKKECIAKSQEKALEKRRATYERLKEQRLHKSTSDKLPMIFSAPTTPRSYSNNTNIPKHTRSRSLPLASTGSQTKTSFTEILYRETYSSIGKPSL